MTDFRLDLTKSDTLVTIPLPAEKSLKTRTEPAGTIKVPFTYVVQGTINDRTGGRGDHLMMGKATVRVGNLVRADLPKATVLVDGSERKLMVVAGRIALPVWNPDSPSASHGRVDVDGSGSPFLVTDGDNVRIASENVFVKVEANEGPATRERAIRDARERLVTIDDVPFRKDCWTYVDVLPSGETHLAHVFERGGRLHVDRGSSPVTELVSLVDSDVLVSGRELLAPVPDAATVRDLLHAGDVVDFLRLSALSDRRSPAMSRFAGEVEALIADGVRMLGSRQAGDDRLAEALENARAMISDLIPTLGETHLSGVVRELQMRIDRPSMAPHTAP